MNTVSSKPNPTLRKKIEGKQGICLNPRGSITFHKNITKKIIRKKYEY